MKTNVGLVAYCEQALKEKWFYGWGSWGQKATDTLVNSLVKQYPSMNTRRKDYMMKAVTTGSRLSDCYGLVKGFLFTGPDGKQTYVSTLDINSGMAYKKATERGPLTNMPDIPGLILYMQGHVGVYLGGGRFAECAGGGKGMCEGRIENGVIVKGSKFTNWFKDVSIDYSVRKLEPEQPQETPSEQPQTLPIQAREIPMIIGDKEVSIKSILYEDFNYVGLRSLLEAIGYTVEEDPFEHVPIISKEAVDGSV